MRKRKTVVIGLIGVAIIAISILVYLGIHKHKVNQQPGTSQSASQTGQTQTTPATASSTNTTTPVAPKNQWPVQISTADAASLTVVVNKKHQLPSTYVPAGLTTFGAGRLRSESANALTTLFNEASGQGITLKLISGYRSYSDQKAVYTSYVNRDGQAAADTYSARPGFSEHQTGLAVDVGTGTCDLDICFGDTSAGKWLAANAQNYGFIIRYPQGKETETGYQYEPWHLRYLGIDTAKSVYASGKTLDQYYNVPAGGYE